MVWNPYELDRVAQDIVLKARARDAESLNQAYKMRATCAYGLERFWGEHLRLVDGKEDAQAKAAFIKDVWEGFVAILYRAGFTSVPSQLLSRADGEEQIQSVAEHLWNLGKQDRQIALAVLTNLCDAVVWWTQRLKPKSRGGG
jgi:hypothetical protein